MNGFEMDTRLLSILSWVLGAGIAAYFIWQLSQISKGEKLNKWLPERERLEREVIEAAKAEREARRQITDAQPQSYAEALRQTPRLAANHEAAIAAADSAVDALTEFERRPVDGPQRDA